MVFPPIDNLGALYLAPHIVDLKQDYDAAPDKVAFVTGKNTEFSRDNRLPFKWITGLKADGTISGCGTVIGLNSTDPRFDSFVVKDINNIICKTDIDKIKSCPNDKLKCEQ